jgi:hypothetical protein
VFLSVKKNGTKYIGIAQDLFFYNIYIIDKNPGNHKFYTAGDGRLPCFPKQFPAGTVQITKTKNEA